MHVSLVLFAFVDMAIRIEPFRKKYLAICVLYFMVKVTNSFWLFLKLKAIIVKIIDRVLLTMENHRVLLTK